MKNLQTVRLKPNPTGKDLTRRGVATAAQLGAEWVDIKNVGRTPVDLTGVTLYHIAYAGATDSGKWEKIMTFTGALGLGKIIRVHAGNGPLNVLRPIDHQGADFHLFTKRNSYVWNNVRSDCAALWQAGKTQPFDKACYSPNPPEGVILIRSGDRLVVPAGSLLAGVRR
ncbi:hypothetical protein [Roseiconus lacunae]|uniref:Uncharacterized protein n=1 Tax=Roseiconus lacunae TaxID=2605694 RepID=A0ABT7PNZ7_9BACT|nr:hypothetical protein [Roseiconus lacunae]MDM4018232.1 hypothetical protein [Roseiconus lacunae]